MQLATIEKVRDQASHLLAQIAHENGLESDFYRQCQALWSEKVENAVASLFYGDFDNAMVILDHGLDVLKYGPETVKRDGLKLEDALLLMMAA